LQNSSSKKYILIIQIKRNKIKYEKKKAFRKKYLANCKNSRKFHYIKLQNVQTASPVLDTFVSSFLILQEIAVF